MHELYIAESILNSVNRALPIDILPESVRQVWIQVGKLDAVIPENLAFIFDAVKDSHRMSEAELIQESIEVHCRCDKCNHEFGLDLPLFICPACGGGRVDVIRGRGIKLTRICTQEP